MDYYFKVREFIGNSPIEGIFVDRRHNDSECVGQWKDGVFYWGGLANSNDPEKIIEICLKNLNVKIIMESNKAAITSNLTGLEFLQKAPGLDDPRSVYWDMKKSSIIRSEVNPGEWPQMRTAWEEILLTIPVQSISFRDGGITGTYTTEDGECEWTSDGESTPSDSEFSDGVLELPEFLEIISEISSQEKNENIDEVDLGITLVQIHSLFDRYLYLATKICGLTDSKEVLEFIDTYINKDFDRINGALEMASTFSKKPIITLLYDGVIESFNL